MSTERFGRDFHNNFDMLSPEFNTHYEDVLDDLIDTCPVARSEVGDGYWVVTRYNDVADGLRNWSTFSSAEGVLVNRPSFEDMPALLPTEMDPPDHTIWRQAMSQYLTAARVAKFAPEIDRVGNLLIDQFIDEGRCDFAHAYSKDLPGRVFFTEVLGTPVADMPYLQKAMDEYIVEYGETQAAAYKRVTDYIHDYLDARTKEKPRGDVVDAILGVRTYTDGSEVPFEDKVGVTSVLLSGGLETAANVISGAVHHLATHPADLLRIAENPELLPLATEEILRVYASTFAISRTAMEDVELHGCPIKKGDMVMFSVGGSSRDPRQFPDRRTAKIDREDNRHIIFGTGPHRCIGSHLARIELRMSLDLVTRRLRDIALDGPVVMKTSIIRVCEHLPITFTAAAS